MAIELYAHPFSSYCQKVLIALYENAIPFELKLLAPEQPENMASLAARWPFKRFPLLVDGARTVAESSIIIEYLQQRHPGPVRLLPADAATALEARFMDRVFDNYVATPQQKCVFDVLREPADRDAYGVAQARCELDTAYAWLDDTLRDRQWAAGAAFTLADCAAAPFLFYADWTHRIDAQFRYLLAYRKRLSARPSVARVVDAARPYRHLFPLGAAPRD